MSTSDRAAAVGVVVSISAHGVGFDAAPKHVCTTHDMNQQHAPRRASPTTLDDSHETRLGSCPLSVSVPAPRPETSET